MIAAVMRWGCLVAMLVVWLAEMSRAADWVRAGVNTDQAMWGLRSGLCWAIAPGGFHRGGEPRGLIRLGYPVLTNGAHDLVNFLAIEPIVKGRRGFSELEPSRMDNARGKRFWAVGEHGGTKQAGLVSGKLAALSSGSEQLDVTVCAEPFDNGAKVRLDISQRSDNPDEIKLAIHAEADSAPMEYCVLTATMGNMVRARQLWLKDAVLDSRQLHHNHTNADFAPHTFHGLDRLARTMAGDVIVAVTTDEADPASVFPFPGTRRWHYGGFPVTQYWKKTRGTFRDDLHVAVNARYTYWQTHRAIPGGVAFENFEMRERFYDGQEFVFGITRRTPDQLGIKREAKEVER